MEQQKFGIIFGLVLLVIVPLGSGVRINEVEMNPGGLDSGNEWVELYSDDRIDLDGCKLVNNDGDEFELEEKFSGYLVIEFEEQWLDNKDEKVFLYDDDLVDETAILNDEKNNNLGWSFCSGWEFVRTTKNQKNQCEDKEEDEQEKNTESSVKSWEDKSATKENINLVTNKVIQLTPAGNEGKIYKAKNEYIKQYAVYSFAIFLFFVAMVLIIKKIKKLKWKREKYEQL